MLVRNGSLIIRALCTCISMCWSCRNGDLIHQNSQRPLPDAYPRCCREEDSRRLRLPGFSPLESRRKSEVDPCSAGSSFEATWPRQNCLLARPPKQGDSNRTILRRWRPSVFLSRVTMYQSRNPWHLSQNYVTTSFIGLVAWSQNYQYFPLSSINTLHSFHSGNKTYDYISPFSVGRSVGRSVGWSVGRLVGWLVEI